MKLMSLLRIMEDGTTPESLIVQQRLEKSIYEGLLATATLACKLNECFPSQRSQIGHTDIRCFSGHLEADVPGDAGN